MESLTNDKEDSEVILAVQSSFLVTSTVYLNILCQQPLGVCYREATHNGSMLQQLNCENPCGNL
jgi:hypothetical protein